MLGFRPRSVLSWLSAIAIAATSVIYEPAASAQAPTVVHTAPASQTTLEVRIQEREVTRGLPGPYTEQPGDFILPNGLNRWLLRGGRWVGAVVGPTEDGFAPFDTIAGSELSAAVLDSPATYLLTSGPGPFAQQVAPVSVSRKTRPLDHARVERAQREFRREHTVFLTFPTAFVSGAGYELSFPGVFGMDAVSFTHAPTTLRSEAVRVMQSGYHPDDAPKRAFVSTWTGSGGLVYPPGMSFRVVDDATSATVFAGTATLRTPASMSEDSLGKNYNKADVLELDFSGLSTPGVYRVVLDGVGTSFPFEIGYGVWERALGVSLRGFLHQRNGIELGPPVTSFIRPRPLHPDDGVVIFNTATPFKVNESMPGEGQNTQEATFDRLVANIDMQTIVPDAWGGYMDAGDWDRHIDHLSATRLLLELYGMDPAYVGSIDLNIPESTNGLPDVLDEAMWNIDCYRRMQTHSGGVRGGIESEEHPVHGEVSWLEGKRIAAFEPGPYASYVYAGDAARLAYHLEQYDAALAAVYRQSALDAMAWAEIERNTPEWTPNPWWLRDARNRAALELYRLTGDTAWHSVFLATTEFWAPVEPLTFGVRDQQDAAFLYAQLDLSMVNATVRGNAIAGTLSMANSLEFWTGQTGFGWTKDSFAPQGFGRPASSASSMQLVRAHALSGSASYVEAIVSNAHFGLGANPLNMSFTIGLGVRQPEFPHHIDSQFSLQDTPEGISLYGPLDQEVFGLVFGQSFVDSEVSPPASAWPANEAYWDIFAHPSSGEYTIYQTIAPNAYAWGYLALTRAAACGADVDRDGVIGDGDVTTYLVQLSAARDAAKRIQIAGQPDYFDLAVFLAQTAEPCNTASGEGP